MGRMSRNDNPQQPLSETNGSKSARELRRYFTEDIREDLLLETELIILSFATGLQDAASWTDYRCFASNQTGNALFLAIGAANLQAGTFSMSTVGMSLGAFIGGGLIVGQIGNFFGPRRRLWLLASSAFQTLLVYAAAAIQYSLPIREDGPAALAGIFLLAFSSGAQVALGRSLKITDITTAMATAAFIDVVVDPSLVKLHNRQRNRRVVFLAMLIAGCFVGTFSQVAINSMFAVILCAVCKTIVTFLFLFNKPLPAPQFEEF